MPNKEKPGVLAIYKLLNPLVTRKEIYYNGKGVNRVALILASVSGHVTEVLTCFPSCKHYFTCQNILQRHIQHLEYSKNYRFPSVANFSCHAIWKLIAYLEFSLENRKMSINLMSFTWIRRLVYFEVSQTAHLVWLLL